MTAFAFPLCYNPAVDGMKQHLGRHSGAGSDTIPEIRLCRYCKGKFNVDPRHPNKEFCTENHRKLHHRYGSLSIGKIAARMERKLVNQMDLIAAGIENSIHERLGRIEELLTEARAESSQALYYAQRASLPSVAGASSSASGILERIETIESRLANIAAAARGALVGGGA